MNRHHDKRRPGRRGHFCWARFGDDDGTVRYHLFRRDHQNATQFSPVSFPPGTPRQLIAPILRKACHQLRDRVDEIDLAAMGVAA